MDDKSKIGVADRSRIGRSQAYEVGYFAQKHHISRAEAREIIQKAGPSRDKANALANRLKH